MAGAILVLIITTTSVSGLLRLTIVRICVFGALECGSFQQLEWTKVSYTGQMTSLANVNTGFDVPEYRVNGLFDALLASD